MTKDCSIMVSAHVVSIIFLCQHPSCHQLNISRRICCRCILWFRFLFGGHLGFPNPIPGTPDFELMVVTYCYEHFTVPRIKSNGINDIRMSKFCETYPVVAVPEIAMFVLCTTVKIKTNNVNTYNNNDN